MRSSSRTLAALLALGLVSSAPASRAQQAPPPPPVPPAPPMPPAPPAPPPQAGPSRADRVGMLEERLAADEKEGEESRDELTWLRKLKITGYVQPQLVYQSFNGAASPNLVSGRLPAGVEPSSVIAKADGTTTNTTMFRLRRARIKADFAPTDYARFVLEMDPIPAGGSGAGVGTYARTAEAIGTAKWSNEAQTDFGMGIFKVPFGFEIPNQSAPDMLFVERSWGADNMFPGLRDVGIRATTKAFDKKLEFSAAVINGILQGEKSFVGVPDLNRAKDVLGRLTYDFGRFRLGASGYWGKGQAVDAQLLRFKQFNRAAFNFEITGKKELFGDVGATFAHVELTVGQNMDRGTKYPFAVPLIPPNVNDKVSDLDQLSFLFRLEQELTSLIVLGARYDFYSPDTSRAGNARHTLSFAAGLNFAKGFMLKNEVDYAFDSVRAAGQPDPKKEIATFSTMMQGRF